MIKKSVKIQKQNSGFVLIMSVLILTALLIVGSYLVASSNVEYKIANAHSVANKTYYLAESGIDEMIWKIKNDEATGNAFFNGTLSSSHDINRIDVFSDSNASYQVTAISNATAKAQLIATSTYKVADGQSRRVVKVNLSTTGGASFNYGVQVDEGGIEMENKAKIVGNVYSNGSIIGDTKVDITGDAWAAGTSTLRGFTVGIDAHANAIENSIIGGDAYYQTISNTTVNGNSYPGSPNPEKHPMPIPQSQIDQWKSDAAAGGEIGDYSFDSGNASLGPVKINGDLHVSNKGILTLTGTIWVTGNVTFENQGALDLNSSYGSLSGILIADGKTEIRNTFAICGSEGYDPPSNDCNPPSESYILILSTNSSLDEGSPAISKENAASLRGILYASSGLIVVSNSAQLLEVTAYKLKADNTAVITYEGGLANMYFSSGPSGSWEIKDWQEQY